MLYWTIILLRLKQVVRFFTSNGIATIVMLPILVIIFLLASQQMYVKHHTWFYILLGLLVASVEIHRRDKRFLSKFKHKALKVRVLEYMLVFLLIGIFIGMEFFVDRANIVFAFFIWVYVHLLGWLNYSRSETPLVKRITKYIPIETYEWRIGMRKQFILFVALYALTMAMSLVAPVLPVFMLYMAGLIFEFYRDPSPKEFLQPYESGTDFFNTKIIKTLIVGHIILAPQYILYITLYHSSEQLFLLFFAIITFSLVSLYFLALKYSSYDSSISKTLKAVLFLFVSPLLPLSAYMVFNEFNQAKWKNKELFG